MSVNIGLEWAFDSPACSVHGSKLSQWFNLDPNNINSLHKSFFLV